jgi:hypothetical protein
LTLNLPASRGGRKKTIIVQPRPEQGAPPGTQIGDFVDFPEACWTYLQSNVGESLQSADPFISSLAVLSAKVGRQRLRQMSMRDLHPLTRYMLEFRMGAERDHTARQTGPALADPVL